MQFETPMRFIYATRANVPDYMIDLASGGNTYRVITDHLGSVRAVVDASTGMPAQLIDYDEFGNVVNDTQQGLQPFGFAGGLYDPDTQLVRFGVRDYDPEVGRWTAKDPIRFRSGVTSLFSYAGGDPVNRLDLYGLDASPWMWDPLTRWIAENGDGAVTAAGRTMMSPWTGPTNLLGILYGLADGSFEGFDNGRIIFSNTGREYDRTIGDVICYGGTGPNHPNRDHEMAHTYQHSWLGPLYIPAHLLSQAASWLITLGSYSQANPLEWGPNQSPSVPWGGP
jgi:RHS repeat-associated protein